MENVVVGHIEVALHRVKAEPALVLLDAEHGVSGKFDTNDRKVKTYTLPTWS